jgi:hypothetical protein
MKTTLFNTTFYAVYLGSIFFWTIYFFNMPDQTAFNAIKILGAIFASSAILLVVYFLIYRLLFKKW